MPGRHLSRSRAASADISRNQRKVRKAKPILIKRADGTHEIVSAKRFEKEHPKKKRNG